MKKISQLDLSELKRVKSLQPPDWNDITPFYEAYLKAPHCEVLKLEESDELLALGAIIFHEKTVWLAHILVHESHRNRGLGGEITKALLERIDSKLYPTVLLIATELGEPVYRRLGFRIELEYAVFKWSVGDFLKERCEHQSFQPKWRDELIELDQLVSGENRIQTLEPHLNNAKLITNGDRLLAAYLPDLGDGLIFARNDQAGITLMKERMADQTNAIFPIQNQAAIEAMASLGLKPIKSVKRMILGDSISWKPEMLYNRIGGNLG